MKRGLDQTTAWLMAVMATGVLFSAGYGVSKWVGRHSTPTGHGEESAAHESHGDHDASAEHEEHGAKAEHDEHGAKAEHDEHGAKAEHDEHGAKPDHEGHGAKPEEHDGDHSPKGEHAEAKPHWDYKGSQGPGHWGELGEEYKLCATGKHQSPSPIDIESPSGNAKLLPIKFHYQDADTVVVNNGHTVQLNFPRGNFVEIDGDHFDLKQLHFHTPSEHKVSGAGYDLEMHLVHQNAQGHLAVVGVLFEEGPANKALAKLWSELPSSGEKLPEPLLMNPKSLLPPRQVYYHYPGSLTTPPCSEGVAWYVLTQPTTISSKQHEVFTKVIQFNSRPVQAINGRTLVKSAR
ncbi:MAG: carbonic anhydrase family protein [Proteobacteria bacterium]|nr:carbonic anhydrase family protein [Pseudomonadota bacterium]